MIVSWRVLLLVMARDAVHIVLYRRAPDGRAVIHMRSDVKKEVLRMPSVML